jgi:hypothetical protein
VDGFSTGMRVPKTWALFKVPSLGQRDAVPSLI